jgi:hypothetical protein
MARGLYRVYLYLVCTSLLIFAAVTGERLLAAALGITPLRGQFAEPTSARTLVQATVFAVVSWIIAGGLGGLHYWLIRRDQRADPRASGGGIRAFFLNAVIANAVLIAVPTAAFFIANVDQQQFTALSGVLAVAITAAAVAAVAEAERRRAHATTRAGLVFQRLQLYSVPFLLLATVGLITWLNAAQDTVTWLLLAAHRLPAFCVDSPAACGPRLLGPWGAALWIVLVLALYGFVVRDTGRSVLRQLFHLAAFGYGLIVGIVGLERAAELLLHPALRLPVAADDLVFRFAFVPPLSFGVVVVAAYAVGLLREAASLPAGEDGTRLTLLALAAGIFGVPFWIGAGFMLHHAVESMVPLGDRPAAGEWATALALVLAGVLALPLAAVLAARTRWSSTASPLRGYVFAWLAAGTLTAAIGAALALYAGGTAALGAPPDNWQYVARYGTEALAVGGVVAALHGWLALRYHLFGPAAPRVPTDLPAPQPA